jgi:hypothetical protein
MLYAPDAANASMSNAKSQCPITRGISATAAMKNDCWAISVFHQILATGGCRSLQTQTLNRLTP